MTPSQSPHPPDPRGGIVVVDKPAGWTSHDVVAKVRRFAHTRRVGHAGTLDPMATGVLVLGVERATRLLGHLALGEKAYAATIRLGASTATDDATGEVTRAVSAREVAPADIRAGVAALTGELDQVPSSVSAVKVGGERAYRKARRGDDVVLASRRVVVSAFDVERIGPVGDVIDVDVRVVCSSGTYVRALARDLGAALGVGGHLTRLRRTRVGAYDLGSARTLEELAESFALVPLGQVAAATFPRVDVDADTARLVSFGQRLPGLLPAGAHPGTVAVFGPAERFLALYEERDGVGRPVAVFDS